MFKKSIATSTTLLISYNFHSAFLLSSLVYESEPPNGGHTN